MVSRLNCLLCELSLIYQLFKWWKGAPTMEVYWTWEGANNSEVRSIVEHRAHDWNVCLTQEVNKHFWDDTDDICVSITHQWESMRAIMVGVGKARIKNQPKFQRFYYFMSCSCFTWHLVRKLFLCCISNKDCNCRILFEFCLSREHIVTPRFCKLAGCKQSESLCHSSGKHSWWEETQPSIQISETVHQKCVDESLSPCCTPMLSTHS